jgi:large subunit ribosomal protein L31
MKKNVHPKYQQVLFVDSATDHKFLCGSTLQPEGRETFQGKDYPVYRVSVSSASHPFFTGSKGLVDAEGRVDKFKKRYMAAQARAKEDQEERQQQVEQPKAAPKKTAKKKV